MIIGVTGKIASGKSEVMKILAEMGFRCIYADKIVHDLYKKDALGAKAIKKHFGKEYLDKYGVVDRGRLRDLVFRNKSLLLLLNKIMHPLVLKEILKLKISGNVAIESVYFDDDLLGKLVDRVILIERPKDKIIATLRKQRGFDYVLAAKAYLALKKPRKVDLVVKNRGSLRDLKLLVSKLLPL